MIDDSIETIDLLKPIALETVSPGEAVEAGYVLYRVGEHLFYAKPISPVSEPELSSLEYQEAILAKYSTPGLEKNKLTRASKKAAMEFDENYRHLTKRERDEFLDKMFPLEAVTRDTKLAYGEVAEVIPCNVTVELK